jgi:lipopolysaccharide biosynthesis glycosyltransferase
VRKLHFTNRNGPVVAYTFDRNYAPYAAVSMASMQAHCSTPIQFYCLYPDEDASYVGVFDQLLRRGFQIKLVGVDTALFADWPVSKRLPRSTYLRLLLPKLVNEDVLVYLDPDTIAYRDIEPIFKIDLGNCLVAAANDIAPNLHPVSNVMKDPYSNAGVLIMNLKAFNKDYVDELLSICCEYGEKLSAFDQCILNVFTDGKKLHLDTCWNRLFIGDQILVEDWKRSIIDPNTRIAHYAAAPKPWHDWAHPAVRAHWQDLVRTYGLSAIPSEPITSTFHLEQLAHLHDINQEFREASAIKGHIVKQFKSKMRG